MPRLNMKIYLDNCCYNRPFDEQSQERVHLEAESILSILQMCQLNDVIIVGSEILEIEINRLRDEEKKQRVWDLYKIVNISVPYTESIRERSQQIMAQSNIKTFDSLHIASAEAAGAKIFLTTDDKLIKMAAGLELNVKVLNPLRFVWEVMFEC